MNNLSEYYQLPSIYKKGKNRHRAFIFVNTTDPAIQALAAEAALSENLEMMKLWFEAGISEADVQRYLGIIQSVLTAERGIEITYETDIPAPVIRQWYHYTHIEAVKRRALLN